METMDGGISTTANATNLSCSVLAAGFGTVGGAFAGALTGSVEKMASTAVVICGDSARTWFISRLLLLLVSLLPDCTGST
jgi:thiamine pyrophosphate-dependent acetolactate synthase large subunit-like protein